MRKKIPKSIEEIYEDLQGQLTNGSADGIYYHNDKRLLFPFASIYHCEQIKLLESGTGDRKDR